MGILQGTMGMYSCWSKSHTVKSLKYELNMKTLNLMAWRDRHYQTRFGESGGLLNYGRYLFVNAVGLFIVERTYSAVEGISRKGS